MAAYADGDDMVARYDVDLIRDLVTDREDLDRVDVPADARLAVALADASGEIEVALMAGGQYTIAQLESLPENSNNHLKAIVCGLAMAALHRRRPESADTQYIESITKSARDALFALKRGENVFGLDPTISASVIDQTGPSAVDIYNRNDLPARMERYFPAAGSRLPLSRGE